MIQEQITGQELMTAVIIKYLISKHQANNYFISHCQIFTHGSVQRSGQHQAA